MKRLILALLLAGGFVIYQPGELPVRVTPDGAGGWNVYKMGEIPTHVTPDGTGGYNAYTPGQIPTQIRPEAPTIRGIEPPGVTRW